MSQQNVRHHVKKLEAGIAKVEAVLEVWNKRESRKFQQDRDYRVRLKLMTMKQQIQQAKIKNYRMDSILAIPLPTTMGDNIIWASSNS